MKLEGGGVGGGVFFKKIRETGAQKCGWEKGNGYGKVKSPGKAGVLRRQDRQGPRIRLRNWPSSENQSLPFQKNERKEERLHIEMNRVHSVP